MALLSILPSVLAMAIAVATAAWVLARSERSDDLSAPWLRPAQAGGSAGRRGVAIAALSLAFYLGVFQRLAVVGEDIEIDFGTLGAWQLFWLHAVLVGALFVWFWAGFAGASGVRFESNSPPDEYAARQLRRATTPARAFCRQLGLISERPVREVAWGFLAGAACWLVVITLLVVLGRALVAAGGERLLPKQAPPMIVWIASLPWMTRLAVSVSAGVFEELFFRGLLQPRIGILASTGLFVLAHASYEQPILLVGITALSLAFAQLVRWRRSVLAAMVAHAAFDAIQLLVVIPMILRASESSLEPIVLWIGSRA